MNETDSDRRESRGRGAAFIVQLGRALLAQGAPAHRIEASLETVSARIGLTGQFFSTPTAVIATLSDLRGGEPRTLMARVRPSPPDIEKLSDLHDIAEAVAGNRLELADASAQIEAVTNRPPRYSGLVEALAYALVSAPLAFFFHGGWPEIAGAGLIGLLVGALAVTVGRWPATGRIFEPLSALLAAVGSGALPFLMPGLASQVVLIGGLIVLLPGLGITLATRELATGHLVAGSGRMAGALVTMTVIAFGVGMGLELVRLLGWSWTLEPANRLAGWLLVPALLAAAAGFTVLFRARPRDLGWILLASAISVGSAQAVSLAASPPLAAFVGALLVGIAGNLFARFRNRPAVVMQIPGIMLLVPGSLGFGSLSAIMRDQVASGIQIAFTAGLVAAGIATGLVLAGVLVPPRRDL